MIGALGRIGREGWRDALRLGLESGTAGALAYLAARAVDGVEPFLVVLMAVGSLSRSVGGTIGQAVARLQSALAGSVIGFLSLALLPPGWGTAAALAVALAAVGLAAALRPAWQLAAIPATGMALAGGEDLLATALATSLGIAIGVGVGTLVSFAVWPDRAEARFERHRRRALRAAAARLADAMAATLEPGRDPPGPAHLGAWNEATWLAEEALGQARFVDRGAMRRRLEALRALHESIVILDRAAAAAGGPLGGGLGGDLGGGPRAEVAALRRDLCAVLLALAEGRGAGAQGAGARIGAADAALDRLGAALEAEGPAAPGRAALAFGLREVRRTLAALVEAEAGAAG